MTAVRTKPLIERLAKLPLKRLHYLGLEWTGMTDATLAKLAPALAGIRNLSLAFNDVTAAGLAALAPYVDGIEFLGLGTSLKQRENGLEIGRGWIDCLCSRPEFRNLRAVTMYNYAGRPAKADLDRLKALPQMKTVAVSEAFGIKLLDAAKSGTLDRDDLESL